MSDKVVTESITEQYLQSHVLKSLRLLRGEYRRTTAEIIKQREKKVGARETANIDQKCQHRQRNVISSPGTHQSSSSSDKKCENKEFPINTQRHMTGHHSEDTFTLDRRNQDSELEDSRRPRRGKSAPSILFADHVSIVSNISGVGSLNMICDLNGYLGDIQIGSLDISSLRYPHSTRHSTRTNAMISNHSGDLNRFSQSQRVNTHRMNDETRNVKSHGEQSARKPIYSLDGKDETSSSPSSSCVTDKLALMRIYGTSNGPEWKESYGWGSDLPLGSWFGVKTAFDGRVIELNLKNNGLSGSFPDDVEHLSRLQVLILDENKLRGPLPGYIFNHMKSLEVFSVRHNFLSDDIPWLALSFQTKLKELWLSHNQFHGVISDDAISYLKNLRYLSLGNNRLTGPIPNGLKYLKLLELLCLGCNSFTGEIPPAIHTLRNIRYLYLHDNHLIGEVPLWIGDFEYLQELSLQGNNFQGYVYKDLNDYKEIEKRYLK